MKILFDMSILTKTFSTKRYVRLDFFPEISTNIEITFLRTYPRTKVDCHRSICILHVSAKCRRYLFRQPATTCNPLPSAVACWTSQKFNTRRVRLRCYKISHIVQHSRKFSHLLTTVRWAWCFFSIIMVFIQNHSLDFVPILKKKTN